MGSPPRGEESNIHCSFVFFFKFFTILKTGYMHYIYEFGKKTNQIVQNCGLYPFFTT